MKITGLSLGVAILGSLGAAGCDRESRESRSVERNEPLSTTPGAMDERQPVRGTAASAADEIAQVRCAREIGCGNVGAGKEYESERACLTSVQSEWREDLNARECPGGINRKELNECLQEIRNSDCKNPIDALGSIVACRTSDICEAMR
jgi:Family of unknown function (DUF6184)